MKGVIFKVAVCKGGNLVLNLEFHRKPVQFFQQQSNMLSLRFTDGKSSSAGLDILQACSLLGGQRPSGMELQQSSREVIMEETKLAVELRDSLERINLSQCTHTFSTIQCNFKVFSNVPHTISTILQYFKLFSNVLVWGAILSHFKFCFPPLYPHLQYNTVSF